MPVAPSFAASAFATAALEKETVPSSSVLVYFVRAKYTSFFVESYEYVYSLISVIFFDCLTTFSVAVPSLNVQVVTSPSPLELS